MHEMNEYKVKSGVKWTNKERNVNINVRKSRQSTMWSMKSVFKRICYLIQKLSCLKYDKIIHNCVWWKKKKKQEHSEENIVLHTKSSGLIEVYLALSSPTSMYDGLLMSKHHTS